MVSLWPPRRVSMLNSLASCLITRVTGSLMAVECADSLRVASISQVPEKFGFVPACPNPGVRSATP